MATTIEQKKQEEIERKIKEIQNYFLQKIIAGDYTVNNINKFRIMVLIDNKYVFPIWIGNGKKSVKLDVCIDSTFMSLESHFTPEEKQIIWDRHKTQIEEATDEILQAKRKQLEELKKELGEN